MELPRLMTNVQPHHGAAQPRIRRCRSRPSTCAAFALSCSVAMMACAWATSACRSFVVARQANAVSPSTSTGSFVVARHSAQDTLLQPPAREHGRVATRALPESLSALSALLDAVPERVEAMGPVGPLYFFVVYVLAECFALPATPLTLSAGYLFGVPLGFGITLLAGTTAACIAFLLARTFLRPQVAEVAESNELFGKINLAVEKEGFKIICLLRLTPLLPFALSNYVYGLSNVNFADYILATILGFAPGTCAYIYFASTAREAFSLGEGGEPWYVYAIGILASFTLLKFVTDIAGKVVDETIARSQEQVAGEGA